MMRGESEHEAHGVRTEKCGGRNAGSGQAVAIDVVIMGPPLRESNIFQQRFCVAEKCCEGG